MTFYVNRPNERLSVAVSRRWTETDQHARSLSVIATGETDTHSNDLDGNEDSAAENHLHAAAPQAQACSRKSSKVGKSFCINHLRRPLERDLSVTMPLPSFSSSADGTPWPLFIEYVLPGGGAMLV
jgi:hypothetical protein